MTKTPGILKIALLQFSAGTDKGSNLKTALALTQEALAKGAQGVLLPEVFNFRGDAKDQEAFRAARENIPGPTVEAFRPLARRAKAFILLGSLLERAPQGLAYNTSVFLDGCGQIQARYRKIHLFDARLADKIIREAELMKAGQRPALARAGAFTFGLSVCYDLRFPDLYQRYARQGAKVLTVPSCFTRKTGEAHWEPLLRARAIENLSYVLAPAQVGTDRRGIQAHGHSMIVAPWGEIIAEGSGDREEIIFGQIEMEEVQKARKALPGVLK